MRSAAKVPGMNAMGLFHDKFVMSWAISENIGNQLTIYPAMLFTYLGTDGGIITKIAEQAGKQDQNQQSKRDVQNEQQTEFIISDVKLSDNQGNEYYVRDNVIYNRYGQKLEENKIPNEIKDQLKNIQALIPIQDLMFDFSSPGNKLTALSENVPCGFNGGAYKFIPLPSIEYAIKYLDNKTWED